VYESDQPLSGIVKILDFGDYLRILFKSGFKKVYQRSDIVIEENWLVSKKASNCNYNRTQPTVVNCELYFAFNWQLAFKTNPQLSTVN